MQMTTRHDRAARNREEEDEGTSIGLAISPSAKRVSTTAYRLARGCRTYAR
jgi:hypothetical protein